MKTAIVSILAAALAISPAVAQASSDAGTTTAAVKGKMLYGSDGKRLGAVYRIDSNGVVYVILEGKLVAIPGSSVTVENGKAQTNLTKAQLLASH